MCASVPNRAWWSHSRPTQERSGKRQGFGNRLGYRLEAQGGMGRAKGRCGPRADTPRNPPAWREDRTRTLSGILTSHHSPGQEE